MGWFFLKSCLQRTANMVQKINIQTLRASFASRTLNDISGMGRSKEYENRTVPF
jgi:hypothetical protein